MTEDEMKKAYMCLCKYEKRMDEIQEVFSPINIKTIANTDAYRCYKDIQTAVNIDELVNQSGLSGQLGVGDDLMNKFIEVVSNENFDMFNYVEYLKQNPAYQKFAEKHKGVSLGQIVFLYSEEHDKEIVKSLEKAKENYRYEDFHFYAHQWSKEKKINEKLSGLDDDSDFKIYKSEFSSIEFPPYRYVLGEFDKRENNYSVGFCSIVTGKKELSGGVPKECESFLQKGALVIFDGTINIGADKAVTFYTPEGKLLGGYREVNGKTEIISPNDNSRNIEGAQQKQNEEKSSKENEIFLEDVGISDMSTDERQALFDRSNNLRREHPVMQDVALTTMCRCYTEEKDKKTKLKLLKELYQIRKGGKDNKEKNEMADTFARVLDRAPELKVDDNLVRLSQRDIVVKQPTKVVGKQVEKF